MTDNKCPKGVNPKAYEQWKEEDRLERVEAFGNLIRALFHLEQLYEVPSESDHPLEFAYEIIYNFGEENGLI